MTHSVNGFDPTQASYRVGAVCRLLNVASRTVSKWVDSGRLAGFRLPGSGRERERRVTREALLAFLRAEGMPIPAALADPRPLAVVAAPSPALAARLGLALGPGWAVRPVGSLFEAGAAVASAAGSGARVVLVLDAALGRGECAAAAALLRDTPSRPRLVAVDTEDGSGGWEAAGFDGWTPCPVDPSALARLVAGEGVAPAPGEGRVHHA